MKNLLQETLDKLQEIQKTPEDISFIGDKSGEWYISYNDFKEIANKNYNDGFGATEVNLNLVIVFKDNTWLERAEYDGAEWWEYKKCPVLNSNAYRVKDKKYIFEK